MKARKWPDEQLVVAVASSTSVRQVLEKLGLRTAGGNYTYVQKKISEAGIQTGHFKGKAWNKGLKLGYRYRTPLDQILVKNSDFQSYKLKRRLFAEGLKPPKCELCGWCECSPDGRVPVELDHINGDRSDNRLANLRVLCPNCHSLTATHRGKNIRVNQARVLELVDKFDLKSNA